MRAGSAPSRSTARRARADGLITRAIASRSATAGSPPRPTAARGSARSPSISRGLKADGSGRVQLTRPDGVLWSFDFARGDGPRLLYVTSNNALECRYVWEPLVSIPALFAARGGRRDAGAGRRAVERRGLDLLPAAAKAADVVADCTVVIESDRATPAERAAAW